jgi:hypothetical protein
VESKLANEKFVAVRQKNIGKRKNKKQADALANRYD